LNILSKIHSQLNKTAEQSSIYKDIMKAVSLFGGVQIFIILIGIIKNKVLAVLLGPEGIGIIGVYTNTLSFLTTATAFGIGFSAIRDIAQANNTNNTTEIAKTILVTRRWIWFTGLFGLFVTLAFSPWLSIISFGNRNFTLSFALLSVTLLLAAISSGQSALLRGLRMLKPIAYSSLYGAISGLILSLPLYYFFLEKGIVPSLIITSITTLLFSWIYSKRVKLERVTMTMKESFRKGMDMARLGTMMTLSNLVSFFSTYLIILFISNIGGLKQTGLYQSAWSLVVVYSNTVLASIAADYYPKLSTINKDNLGMRQIANQQTETLLLLIGPMALLMIVFIPWIIVVLFSKEFLEMVQLASLLLVGLIFHAVTLTIGYIFMAKGDAKNHLINEVGIKTSILPLTIIGYYFMGLIGIGLAYLLSNLISFLAIYFRAKRLYDYKLFNPVKFILGIELAGCIAVTAISYLDFSALKYSLYAFATLLIFSFSVFEFNKRINILVAVKSKLNHRSKKQ